VSRKPNKKTKAYVKCAYCGREDVPVSRKGFTKPHVKADGKPCLIGIIPFPEKISRH